MAGWLNLGGIRFPLYPGPPLAELVELAAACHAEQLEQQFQRTVLLANGQTTGEDGVRFAALERAMTLCLGVLSRVAPELCPPKLRRMLGSAGDADRALADRALGRLWLRATAAGATTW